jgi:hypothetical protein
MVVYFQIPGGMSAATASSATGSLILPSASRVCGRFFAPTAATATANVSVCCKFQIRVVLNFIA